MSMETTVAAGTIERRPLAPTFRTLPSDHRFFSVMSIVMSLAIAGGFFNTYVRKLANGTPALSPIIHVHAVVFTAWLVVYVVQSTLVLNGRVALHKRIGTAAMGLAALMVVLGVMTSIAVTRLGERGIPGVEFADPAGFLLLNLGAIAVFAVLVSAGWYYRRSAQTHKRLMLMANAGALIGPGVSRLPIASGNTPLIAILAIAFMLAGPIYDLITRRRVHPAYLIAFPLAFLATPPIVTAVAASAAWQRIAAVLLQ